MNKLKKIKDGSYKKLRQYIDHFSPDIELQSKDVLL